jgi:PAS domain S-box-containing protein
VFGWTAEEAVGQPAAITFTPEDRENLQHEWETETAGKEGVAPNIRWHIRKDGKRIFIEGSTLALRDTDGTLLGFLKVGQDVTERRAAEERLRESEERFRQFGEASSDLIWIRDAGTLQFESATLCNPAPVY